MSLSAPPATGYQDYQRTLAQDGPVLYSHAGNAAAEIVSPTISVGAYWGISVLWSYNVNVQFLQFIWQTATGTICGTQTVHMGNWGVGYSPLVLPNVGPYLTVQAGSDAATYPIPINFTVLGTNRSSLPVTPGAADLLIDVQGTDLAGANYFYPSQAYAGQAQLWFQVPNAQSYIDSQVWTGTEWVYANQYNLAAAGESTYNIRLPLSSWRLVVNNQTTAGAYYVAVQPSVNGNS